MELGKSEYLLLNKSQRNLNPGQLINYQQFLWKILWRGFAGEMQLKTIFNNAFYLYIIQNKLCTGLEDVYCDSYYISYIWSTELDRAAMLIWIIEQNYTYKTKHNYEKLVKKIDNKNTYSLQYL